jgi:hypothetical protein
MENILSLLKNKNSFANRLDNSAFLIYTVGIQLGKRRIEIAFLDKISHLSQEAWPDLLVRPFGFRKSEL